MVGKSKRVIGQLVQCTQCGEWKEWRTGVFKSEKNKPRQPCIECDTIRRSINAKNNIERERISARQRTAKYREQNPDKVYEQNHKPRKYDRAKANQRIRRWKKKNRSSVVTAYHQRKAMKQALPNSFRREDWQICLEYWGNRCCICGRKPGNGYVIAQEHWIAISDPRPDNPGHVPWNIVPMCHAKKGSTGGCNNAKWKQDPIEWLNSHLDNERAKEISKNIYQYFQSLNAVTPPVMEWIFRQIIKTLETQ